MTEAVLAESVAVTGGAEAAAIERETMARVSLRLIPFLFILYLFNFLDRTNVALAGLQMNRDLRFSSTAFGFGAGIFFVGYAAFEIPSNIVLVRVGARRWSETTPPPARPAKATRRHTGRAGSASRAAPVGFHV